MKDRILKPAGRWKLFDIVNTSLMLFLIFVTLYPFWYCIVGSFNEGADYMMGGVNFWPRKFTLENYISVLQDDSILNAYVVSILRTVIGTFLAVAFTSLFSYGFTRPGLRGKKVYAMMGLITMYFTGGLIPQYLLYDWLNLLDKFWVYIIPHMFSFYNVIIMQSFFKTIPESINESAKIDGASEYRIFVSLILPLSLPVLAVMTLFNGVSHWNNYFDSLVFTLSPKLQTVQVFLMKVIKMAEFANSFKENSTQDTDMINIVTLQMATMIITTAPILALYPFLQKYFVKGMMIGSIKG